MLTDVNNVIISNRVKQILNLIANEFTAHENAKQLYISKHTVDSHRKKTLENLL